MTPDQYHSVLLSLDQALRVFEHPGVELNADDRELLRQLEIIRSQVLKAESGHPFPLQTILPPLRPSSGDPSPAPADAAGTPPSDPAVLRPGKIRVLIADDHDSVRSILRALLSVEPDFEVIAEARHGGEAVELAAAAQPDLIIMDLNMPVMDGIDATREALRLSPATRVLMFSANQDPLSVRRSVEAGAHGYLCKPAPRKVLLAALRDVHRGRTAFAAAPSFAKPGPR